MQFVCVLLGVIAVALADPTTYFVEKFDKGSKITGYLVADL